MTGDLQPSDRIIDLRAITRSAGLFAGITAAPLAAWVGGSDWVGGIEAVLSGGIGGRAIGGVAGRFIFPAPPGETVATRPGAASLGLAMKASVCGSMIIAALIAGVAILGIVNSSAIWAACAALGTGLIVGVAIGICRQ